MPFATLDLKYTHDDCSLQRICQTLLRCVDDGTRTCILEPAGESGQDTQVDCDGYVTVWESVPFEKHKTVLVQMAALGEIVPHVHMEQEGNRWVLTFATDAPQLLGSVVTLILLTEHATTPKAS